MEKFNNNLKQFIDILKVNYPDQVDKISAYYSFDSPGDKYITDYLTNCTNNGDDISSKNEIIFSKGSVILTNINFYKIWNDDNLLDEQRENIWKYLHTLYIFAYEHKRGKDCKTLLNDLKNKDSSKLDEESKTFKNIVDSLKTIYKDIDGDGDEIGDELPSSAGIPVPELFNGIIGNLAKEIAEDIDPSKVNLEDPSKLLSSLMNGTLDKDNDESGIFNLVQDITGKIQDKISSGDLNEKQLLSEAQDMMKSLSGGAGAGLNLPGMGKDFDPMSMFNNIMKSGAMADMPGMEGMAGMAGMEGMAGMAGLGALGGLGDLAGLMGGKPPPTQNLTANQLNNKTQLKTTRDRLRHKLEERKKVLEDKKKRKESTNQSDDIDLDALADEIDGM